MKILEVLVQSGDPNYIEEFMHALDVEKITLLNTVLYRWEVRADLVCLFYTTTPESAIARSIWEHLQKHLYGIIVLGNDEFYQHLDADFKFWNNLQEAGGNRPIVFGIKLNEANYLALQPALKKPGLYLTDSSQLIFWNVSQKESIKNIIMRLFDISVASGEIEASKN